MAISGPGKWYGRALLSALSGEMDLTSDTLKIMLTTSDYTPDQDNDQYLDDVSGEVSGEGYTAGGATLANVSLTYNAATNTVVLDCNDIEWEDSTLSGVKHAVIYDDEPVEDSDKPLLGFITFESELNTTAGTLTLTVDAAGLLTATAS